VKNIDDEYDLSEDEEKTSPHKKAAREELAETVKHILKDLPERELNVIHLKFFSELSNREIVDVTGLSESNVAVILYRTLQKIKPELKYFA
jgi:RNA polymerase sigma-70 factor (ECF subfamily)